MQLQLPEINFNAKIGRFKKENTKLSQKLFEWRDKATAESEYKRLAEEEIRQQYKIYQQFQKQARNYAITADYFKNIIFKYVQGLDRILLMLENLKTEVSLEFPNNNSFT
jgi:hypothetical protein